MQGLVDHDPFSLKHRMKDYFENDDYADLKRKYPELLMPRARYEKPKNVWKNLRQVTKYRVDRVTRYLLFPLDGRWIYYETEEKLLNERRPEFWDNLAEGNRFLVVVPEPRRPSPSTVPNRPRKRE